MIEYNVYEYNLTSISFRIPSHNIALGVSLMFPGQPVVDLETYMQSLERKQQSVEKMIAKLDARKEEPCKKYLGSSPLQSHNFVFQKRAWNNKPRISEKGAIQHQT